TPLGPSGPPGPSASPWPPPTGAALPGPPRRPLPATSLVDDVFGSSWRDEGVPAHRGALLGALGIGLLAGLVLPYAAPGLGLTLVLLASGVLVLALSTHRREPFTWACAVLCAGFALVLTVRDAPWVVVLGLLVSALLTTTALVAGRSALGMFLGAAAWPLAGLRGLPWLGRSLRTFGAGAGAAAVVRTVLLSLGALLVFGVLFATGDAIVGHWLGLVLPDLGGSVLLRVFTAVAVTGVVLAAAYLALNPLVVTDRAAGRRPAQHRFEWLAPVLLVDAVFGLFLAAQAAAFLGGHDYVRRVTGLTYAGYVHQGFVQLTTATALMLLVVWAASRKAAGSAADRRWLRASLGLLCALTLVVVASALHRVDLYQDAYGFTRLRLLVGLFEGWLGVVVVAVLVAGIRLRGAWLPRLALLTGAALLLGLAAVNPDAWIARHNLERFDATGKLDTDYLAGLSADALPTILAHRLPASYRCELAELAELPVRLGTREYSWAGWNLGRAAARTAVRAEGAAWRAVPAPGCP
ncbi:MAG: histidine kinase, partial [Marmoricola sp.]|nr:histidine kinase [Marmoricola sp.]